jgi:uncharacterized protein YeaO (DUF488 family)
MIRIKRVYEPHALEDGRRVLVDRLWPRGVSKDAAAVEVWMRELAPSDELRRWFGHAPERFPEFRRRYLEELKEEPAQSQLAGLAKHASHATVTLVFGAKDAEHNNAVVLAEEIERRVRAAARAHATARSKRAAPRPRTSPSERKGRRTGAGSAGSRPATRGP